MAYVEKLLQDALGEYYMPEFVSDTYKWIWLKAFIHTSVFSDEYFNYELGEFYGDAYLHCVIPVYIRDSLAATLPEEKFKKVTHGTISKINSHYSEKIFVADIATKIGLGKHILVDEEYEGHIETSILEDVFESLFGSMAEVVQRVRKAGSFEYCYKLFKYLFEGAKFKVTLEDAEKDYVTKITQLPSRARRIGYPPFEKEGLKQEIGPLPGKQGLWTWIEFYSRLDETDTERQRYKQAVAAFLRKYERKQVGSHFGIGDLNTAIPYDSRSDRAIRHQLFEKFYQTLAKKLDLPRLERDIEAAKSSPLESSKYYKAALAKATKLGFSKIEEYNPEHHMTPSFHLSQLIARDKNDFPHVLSSFGYKIIGGKTLPNEQIIDELLKRYLAK